MDMVRANGIDVQQVPSLADRWLSVQEVAVHLGVSRETIYAWIKGKQMPAHRVGRHWKFKRREVDDWVRANGEPSTMMNF